MEGVDFGWLMNALAEPEPWPSHGSDASGDQYPERRSNLGEDARPVSDPRLLEEPSTVIPRRVEPLEHSARSSPARPLDPEGVPR